MQGLKGLCRKRILEEGYLEAFFDLEKENGFFEMADSLVETLGLDETNELIFMDIRMPVMKGDEATMKIRQLDRADCKKIPIIAMTANALESDVENSYNCGMNGHISKPIEPEEVYRCLNKWLIGA